jgi:hypothetical protein
LEGDSLRKIIKSYKRKIEDLINSS